MNDQVRKILRSSFCHRDKWVEDNKVTTCFKCDKKFHVLYRRKHHCRVCGNIFCNLCSEYSLSGQDMDDDEKEIRTCEACYKKCWKFIQQNDPIYYIKKRGPDDVIKRAATTIGLVQDSTLSSSGQSNSVNMSKRFSKTEDEKLKEIRCLINDFNLEGQLPMVQQIKSSQKKLSLLVQYVLKANKIPFDYYDFLFDLSRRIIREVQPNAMITHNMDISKHIKIKLEKSLEGISAKYIVGTVLKKGVSSKKMASSFGDCRVMLVYGNIEAKDVVTSKGENVAFQEMIENRKKSMKKVLAKLKEMEVDMIFLEGSIEKEAQDIFFSGGITVIAKVKIETLTRLKLSLEVGRIVEGIGQLNEHNKQTSVGKSRLSYFSKMTRFDDVEEDILVVEGHKAQNGLTVVLCGPQEIHLKAIKQELKTILRIGRHLFLKNYKVNLDKQLVQSMQPDIRNTLVTAMTPNIFFSGSAQRHQLTILSYLKNKHLDYKRIVYVESDFSPINFPDVTRQMIEQYNKNRHRHFRRKWPFFTQICGSNYRDESRRFYSEDDWPMGQYILKKLVNLNKKCQTCRKPCYNHTQVYYGRNLYVRIEAETRIIEDESANEEFQEADPEYIYEMLARSKTKHKLECYIECQQCHEQLSSRFVVGQEHLELSLLSFLGNIFSATNYSMTEPVASLEEGGSCSHHKKCRVFQFGASFLRVYVDFLIIFKPYAVSSTFREEYIRGRDHKAVFDTCLELNSNVQKVVGYLHDEIKKVTETVNNTNFQSMVRNPKQSFLKARSSFISARQTVTQSDCVNLFMPQLLEQINRINHASQALISAKRIKNFMDARHNATNCVYLLRKMLRLVWQVKKSIQKRQLNQKFQNRQDQIDDQLMLQQVDINAMANGEQSQVQSQVSQSQSHMQSSIIQDNMSEYNKTQADEQTNWIAMHSNFVDGQHPQRKLRKTESNLSVRAHQKPTQDNIQSIFKTMLTGFKAETAFLSYISCSAHEPQSLMASALNSFMHKQLILSGQKIESLKVKMITTDSDFNNQNQQLRKINVFLEAQEKMLKLPKEKRTSQQIPQVNILYPTDFEEVRQSRNISMETFITTIAGSQQWSTGGGKSGSLFMRSHNQLVVIKRVNDKEFQTLRRLLQTYFNHLKEGSLLTPILGAFEVIRSNKLQYYIVMENLFFGMEHWYIYDFKGSKNRRFSKPPAVPLDLNFLLDRNSQPIFTAQNLLKFLPKTLNFLVESNIIDYSLILVIHVKTTEKEIPDGSQIRIGVVDYLREFGVNEKIEKAWKGSGCTVAEPGLYRDRMQASISRYFSALPG